MQLVKPDVATICTGMAASMGAVLLCAGADGKRSCLPHSRGLIHQPLGGVQGQSSDILIAAKEIEKTREELCSIVAYHTKVTGSGFGGRAPVLHNGGCKQADEAGER